MKDGWEKAAAGISLAIFKITTHNGNGTGFLLTITGPNNNRIYGIATAFHVISAANELDMPIRLTHHTTKTSVVLKANPNERVILVYPEVDLAIILTSQSLLGITLVAPKIVEAGVTKKSGLEIGWYGFPSMAINELCFFHGFISTPASTGYLVDGVVIHGVSGGPAFYIQDDEPRICGVITQYLPNIATGQTLPGLGYISSVESYQKPLSELSSLNQAEKIAEVQRETSPSMSASASPSPSAENEA